MGFFSLLFKQQITCPLCKETINVKRAKEDGTVELLGKDAEGYIHLKYKGACGARIIWNTLNGKTYEKDIPEEFLK